MVLSLIASLKNVSSLRGGLVQTKKRLEPIYNENSSIIIRNHIEAL